MAKQYVTHVKLQTAMHLPKVGEMGNTLPSVTKTVEGLSMYLTAEGLYVQGSRQGKSFKSVIPYGNIVIMELGAKEEDAPAKEATPVKAEKNGNKKD